MKSRVLLVVLGLLLAAGFAALGRWQLQRGLQKETALAQVAQVMHERRPQGLDLATRASGYDWAAGRGHFLKAPVLLLDNQRHGDAVGVRVLLPFRPDQGRPLLVDMGWIELPGDRKLPEVAVPAGEQRLSGLLTLPPSMGIALGPGHVELGSSWLLTRVDVPALSAASGLPLAARILRLDPALPLGYPRDLDLLSNTLPPERHRGYALQWFGLALATVVTVLLLSFRRRP